MTKPHPPRKVVHRSPSPGRGGRTRGWKKDAPKRGNARHNLPRKCLLDPEGERYPICNKSGAVDCRGVAAAKVRSKQYHDQSIYIKAQKAEKKYCSPPKTKKSPSKKSRKTPSQRKKRSSRK